MLSPHSFPNQGQGPLTAGKQAGLIHALQVYRNIHLGLGRRNQRKFPDWRPDLFIYDSSAGCGWNHDAGIEGSPLLARRIFTPCLEYYDLHYTFCDRNVKAVEELIQHIWSVGRLQPGEHICFEAYDNDFVLNRKFVRSIRRLAKPEKARGVVLVDVNGCLYKGSNGNGPPMTLPAFFKIHRVIDVVINASISQYWRQYSNPLCQPMKLMDFIRSLDKTYWLLRLAERGGHHSFITFIGSNYYTEGELGFESLDSPRNQEFLDWLDRFENGERKTKRRTKNGG